MRGEARIGAKKRAPRKPKLFLRNLRRPRRAAVSDFPDASRAHARRLLSSSRFIVVVAVIALGATLLCAGLGYTWARQSDERLWAEQRAALRNAIAEFRTLVRQERAGRSAPRCAWSSRAPG